jgi:hypothetical protein
MQQSLLIMVVTLVASAICRVVPSRTFGTFDRIILNGTDEEGRFGAAAGKSWEPLDDTTWDQFKCKGQRFQYLMTLSDEKCGQALTPPKTSCVSEWSGWGKLTFFFFALLFISLITNAVKQMF